MKKYLIFLIAFCAYAGAALAQNGGATSAPDPYTLTYCCGTAVDGSGSQSDNFSGNSYKQMLGLNVRNAPIDPTKKTLILIGAPAQSNETSVLPTLYVPANSAVIDQFNVFDGSGYDIQDSLLGCTFSPINRSIKGNILARLADKAVPTFDRVIIGCLAIGSTTYADWATGELSDRIQKLVARFAARGITPTTPGTTWAVLPMLGEQDTGLGTSFASLTASFATIKANILAAIPTARIFLPLESYDGLVNGPNVRQMETNAYDGVTVFPAGDNDTIVGTPNRQAGNPVHFDDTGGAAVAAQTWLNMQASGAPF